MPLIAEAVGLALQMGVVSQNDAERLTLQTEQDQRVVDELAVMNSGAGWRHSEETGLDFANPEVGACARQTYDTAGIDTMETLLADNGALDLPIKTGKTVTVGGVQKNLSLLGATSTAEDGANHGEMSNMVWIRDQTQAAQALIEQAIRFPDRYQQEGEQGKALLLSALHLMSTNAQLNRFQAVIDKAARREPITQADWPHICMTFDNLDSEHPNNWRNKQDAFQMLAYATLDALDRGFLQMGDLDPAHVQFLSSVTPFLKAVGYPRYENSASWEEAPALRTSALSIEVAYFDKLRSLIDKNPAAYVRLADTDAAEIQKLMMAGLAKLGRRLPFEAPDHNDEQGMNRQVKYREADAALMYVLDYGIPQLLAKHNIPLAITGGQPMPEEVIELLVLQQIATLSNDTTNGLLRYIADSYQGLQFHTPAMQTIVSAIKQKTRDTLTDSGEPDYVLKQYLRDEIMPEGHAAAWVHPLAQLSSWAAKRALDMQQRGNQTRAAHYQELSAYCLNRSLSNITGEQSYNMVRNAQGDYEIQQAKGFCVPECWIAYETSDGKIFWVPSPHSPLYWAVAMIRKALCLHRVACSSPDGDTEAIA